MHNQILPLLVFFIIACGTKPQKPSPTTEIENPELNQDSGSGGRVGNGGSGVLCRTDDGKINSIELFDFYEARAKLPLNSSFSYEIDFEPKTGPKLDQALELARFVVESRVKDFDPALAKYLLWRLDQFKDESTFSESQLPMTDDIEPLRAIHKNCRAIQLAFTAKPNALNPEKFHIYRPAFEHPKFSPTNRAALILHELIYELTALRGETTSVGTRGLIALIFTNKYKEAFATRADYFLIANDAGMPWAGFGELAVKLEDGPLFYEDRNTLKDGHILPGGLAPTKLGPLTIMCRTHFSKEGVATAFTFTDLYRGAPRIDFDFGNGEIQNFTVFPHVGFEYTPPAAWNRAYQNKYLCPERDSYSVIFEESLPHYFFAKITPAITATEKNHFFEYKIDLDSNVTIDNGVLIGEPNKNARNRHLTFFGKTQGSSCFVSKATNNTIILDDCVANPFKKIWQAVQLPIHSVERITEPFLKLRLRNTNDPTKKLFVPVPDSSPGRMHIKTGSDMHIDSEGRIRKATVIWSQYSICVKGIINQNLHIDYPAGRDLTFDEKGCIENLPELAE